MSLDDLLLDTDIDDAAEAAIAAAAATVDEPHASPAARTHAAHLLSLGVDDLKKLLRTARTASLPPTTTTAEDIPTDPADRSQPVNYEVGSLPQLEELLDQYGPDDWWLVRLPAGADPQLMEEDRRALIAASNASGIRGVHAVVVPDVEKLSEGTLHAKAPTLLVHLGPGGKNTLHRLNRTGLGRAPLPRSIAGRALAELLADPAATYRAGPIERELDWWRRRYQTDQSILDGLWEILETFDFAPFEVRPSASFVEDLNLDNRTMSHIAGVAQDKFNIDIPEEDVAALRLLSIGDFATYIHKRQYETGRRTTPLVNRPAKPQ